MEKCGLSQPHSDSSGRDVRSDASARCCGDSDIAEAGSDLGVLSLSSGHDAQALRRKVRHRPTREVAENAVRTLIAWAGDDPAREGLRETPARVVRSYAELFGGYNADPEVFLEKTFAEVGGYDELIVLKDIRVMSCCEHHMLPIVGRAHVGYLPDRRVVGISKIARVVDAFARRLQIQEKLAVDIAKAIETALKPRGVGVVLEAEHCCMALRGVNRPGTMLTTSCLRGALRDDARARTEFLRLVRN